MTEDEKFDKGLPGTSRVAPPVEPAVLKRIADSINSSLYAVRPLAPTWVLAAKLTLICAVLAVTVAASAGLRGVEGLGMRDCVLIFSTLGILIWVTATVLVSQLIPGSRPPLGEVAALISVSAALLGVFALMFRDYRTDHFISAGVSCLLTGVLLAIPAASLSWLLLRRGFAVNPIAAGLAGGALAGLCGVTMLELHCPNSLAWHVLVWHTAVVPASAAGGALAAWALRAV